MFNTTKIYYLVIHCLLIVCISVSSISCAQEIVKPLFPCTSRIDNPYGVCAHFSHKTRDYPSQKMQMELMKAAGITNVRYDFWVPYTDTLLQHELLPITLDATEKVCKENIKPLGILFVGWNGQRAWQRKPQYSKFLEYLITNYKDKVSYWEVFNEVNLTAKEDCVDMSTVATSYVDMLSYSYKKIKSANPTCIVTSSGLAEVNDDFIELLSKHKAYNYFDVLNIHSYEYPEAMPSKFEKIKMLMDEYGWLKPLWISECGMPTQLDSVSHFFSVPNQHKEREQAYRIPRMYIISFAYGVDKVYTYNFRAKEVDNYYTEDNFGIVHADLTPKPAYFAYKTLTTMLPTGSTRPTLLREGNSYVSSWKRKDGKKVWALWNSKGDETIDIEITGKAEFYNFLGERLEKHNSGKLNIGKGVTYIVGGGQLSVF